MLDLPTKEDVEIHDGIKLWIAPAVSTKVVFDFHWLPTRLNWSSGCAPAQDVNVHGGWVAKQIQYSLKHIRASIINKSQGATLPYGITVEISEQNCPWESHQIVVSTSRAEILSLTVIMGSKEFAIQKTWELVTTRNQWTQYIKHIVQTITLNREEDVQLLHKVCSYFEASLFCRIVSKEYAGFVYCLTLVAWHENL